MTESLRQRLTFGGSLAVGIASLLCADGYLAQHVPPRPHDAAATVQTWLMNGAISTAIALVLTWLTTGELVRFAKLMGFHPFAGLARLFAVGLVIGPYVAFNLERTTGSRDEAWGMLWLALALGLAFLLQAAWRRTQGAMVNLATTVFIIFYAGGLAGYMIKLRMEVGGAAGAALLLLSMLVCKLTDTGAFFIGSMVGRNKLIEWLSPKKTWEGFAGGLATAVASAVLVGGWLNHVGIIPLPAGWLGFPWGLVLFGLVMGIVSTAGDLCASLLKRDAAVKDSSQMIPGMGGVLDIFDSPLLTAPLAWFFWTRVMQAGG